MEVNGRTYLSHDSFADCSKVYEKEYDEILKVLEYDASSLLGELSEIDLQRVRQTIKIARTISVRVKKKYDLL